MAQPVCVGLDTKRDSIQAHWPLATNGDLPAEQRRAHFNKIFHFASQCPEHFADTALLALLHVINLTYDLDSISYWLEKAETFAAAHGQHLSHALHLKTVFDVRFQKYRHLTTLGYYDAAIEQFISLLDQLPEDHPDTLELQESNYIFRLYLGWLHYKKGDYPKALEWYTMAQPFLPAGNFNSRTAHFEHLGMISMALGKYEQAKGYLFESERQFFSAPDSARPNPEYLLYTYLDLVEIFNVQHDPDSAFIFLEKARQLDMPNQWAYVRLKRKEGETFLKNGNHDEAIRTFEEGMELADSLFAGKQFRKGELMLCVGETYLAKQAPLPALRYIQKSLAYFEESFNSGDFSQNPGPENTPLKFEMLRAFLLKGRALLAQSEATGNDPHWLKMALSTFGNAIDLIQILRNHYIHDVSKEMLSQTSFQVFELAIETARQLFLATDSTHYMELAFSFAEKSKALSLLESLTDIGAKQFASIPDSLLRQETGLKLQIAHYERSAGQANSEEKRNSNLSEAFEKRRELEQFLKKLEAENPAYFNMKYAISPPTMASLGQELNGDETFAEFFWGDRNMYFFTVTKDTAHWGAFPVDSLLRQQVETFKNLAASRTALLRPSNLKKFSRLGHALYQRLIVPLDLKTPKVLLAADAWLNLLPFDALLTDSLPRDDYARFPFLIRQRQVTRVFSASVLAQGLHGESLPHGNGSLLVIAPDQQLQGRPDSLAIQFGGESMLNGNALKQLVLDQAKHFRHLLFYAHAKADTIEPFIHLHGEEKLYLKDLYAQPMPAELVILAACEAGSGEVKRGEGVMSLARGFAYGGASNVGLTLWEVQSGTTLRLAGHFLSGYFEKKLSAADAMHRAKLEFLAAPPVGDASPYLWAGFVLVGR